MKKIIMIMCGALFVASASFASTGTDGILIQHSGGTDAAGCHVNRKTGVYHCH